MSCNCKTVDCSECIYCLNITLVKNDYGNIEIEFFGDDEPLELEGTYTIKSEHFIEQNITIRALGNILSLNFTTESISKMRFGVFAYKIIRTLIIDDVPEQKTIINGLITVKN